VVSIDALTDEDIRRAGKTPNLSRLINNENINGIYPSLTHPCHATIITGKTLGFTEAELKSRYGTFGAFRLMIESDAQPSSPVR
jgi:hypothetical protein